MFTPWGMADYKKKIVRGVTIVGTPGHGGIMVSKGFAEKNLSKAAVERGIPYGGYYAYEEDCNFAIPEYELLNAGIWPMEEEDKKNRLERLFKSLSRWNADYLMACGVDPDPEGLKFWKETQEMFERNRALHT